MASLGVSSLIWLLHVPASNYSEIAVWSYPQIVKNVLSKHPQVTANSPPHHLCFQCHYISCVIHKLLFFSSLKHTISHLDPSAIEICFSFLPQQWLKFHLVQACLHQAVFWTICRDLFSLVTMKCGREHTRAQKMRWMERRMEGCGLKREGQYWEQKNGPKL